MSAESDQAAVLGTYPKAHLKHKVSTGGSKIQEWVIKSGTGDDLPVGPWAFSEEKAWRYAAERLSLGEVKLWQR